MPACRGMGRVRLIFDVCQKNYGTRPQSELGMREIRSRWSYPYPPEEIYFRTWRVFFQFGIGTRYNRFSNNRGGAKPPSRFIFADSDLVRFHSVSIIVTIMANNVQFSIAVHLMAGLACKGDEGVTSSDLAQSVNTSASFVRRTLAKLSKAGLVETVTGKAGACWLAKSAKEISLLDIYSAVDAPKAFAIHNYEEQGVCYVSCNIKTALEKVLTSTQKAMEVSLAKISLAQIVAEVRKK